MLFLVSGMVCEASWNAVFVDYFHVIFLFSIIEFPFHLEKNLNFQRYNFLIGILDVCRIPRIYLNAKINVITSLRLLFYSESMRESSPYLKYSMVHYKLRKSISLDLFSHSTYCLSLFTLYLYLTLYCLAWQICDAVPKFCF